MIINCIAIDDEPLALVKLEEYAKKVPFLHMMAVFDDPLLALDFLKNNAVDLAFLDVRMDKLSGLKLLEVLNHRPKVILVTAYDSYALQGFELDVSDYLLKPVSFERFVKAVEKVYDDLRYLKEPPRQEKPEPVPTVKEEFIFIKTEYRMQKVFLADILFIEGMKDYLRIHTYKERIMTLMSFHRIEEMLPAKNFVRIHKSYIIALGKIESIEKNHIKVAGHELPIGDMYRKQFFDLLEGRKLI
jgi:two-component system, LytTR family, response regulator